MKKAILCLLLAVMFAASGCSIPFLKPNTGNKPPVSVDTPAEGDEQGGEKPPESGDDKDPSDDDKKPSAGNQAPETPSDGSEIAGYTLIWRDEFGGNALSSKNWSYQIGDGSAYGIPAWGNGEAQYYRSENVSVRGGNLVITAKKESSGGKRYTSARIRSAGKVSFTYGRLEARMALPEGKGLWPAFWLLPEETTPYGGWPSGGEIDIMEARGRLGQQTTGALHFSMNGHRYETAAYDMEGRISDFHVYALDWTPAEIRWLVDDVCFLTVTAEQWSGDAGVASPFDTDFHILFNLAVGGHFDGYLLPEEEFVSAEMKVDYVRLYKRNG